MTARERIMGSKGQRRNVTSRKPRRSKDFDRPFTKEDARMLARAYIREVVGIDPDRFPSRGRRPAR